MNLSHWSIPFQFVLAIPVTLPFLKNAGEEVGKEEFLL